MIDLSRLPAADRDIAAEILALDPELSEWARQVSFADVNKFRSFEPRPDDVANFDQQSAYVNARDSLSFLMGGNGSGKTACSALKASRFLMSRPPPRPDTPFWIVAQKLEQAAGVCWKEKLWDLGFLPKTEVDQARISWQDVKQGYPASVPLKPWPVEACNEWNADPANWDNPKGTAPRHPAVPGANWRIDIKSVEQGRAAMQAASIGGFWFSEQFPLNIFLEILRGCRDYFFPGGQFCEFTPIEPELCLWVEQLMDNPPKDWGFYRCNTAMNKANTAPGWYEQFFGAVPDEMLATRQTGALASFEGVIYQSFNVSVHCLDPGHPLMQIPDGCEHFMATDWGASSEHPHATGLGCRDGMGTWRIYDEYWNPDQGLITLDHADRIIEMCDQWGWPTTLRRERKTGNSRLVLAGDDPNYGYNFADPSRPGEINEFNFYGIPTAPANNRVYEGIDTIRSLLKLRPPKNQPMLFISRKCKHLIEELRKYRWLKGKKSTSGQMVLNPKVAAPQPLKRDDDSVDWLRYMIHSAEKQRGAGITSTDQHPEGFARKSVALDKGEGRKDAPRMGSRKNRPGWFKPQS